MLGYNSSARSKFNRDRARRRQKAGPATASAKSPWSNAAGNSQTQRQTVSLSQIQNWADHPDDYSSNFSPAQSQCLDQAPLYTRPPQNNAANIANTGGPVPDNIDQSMFQNEPNCQMPGGSWNGYANDSFMGENPNYNIDQFGHRLDAPVQPYGAVIAANPLLSVSDVDEDLDPRNTLNPPQSETNFSQYFRDDVQEIYAFNMPVPENESVEVATPAPFQQGEGQQQQQQQQPEVFTTVPQLTMPPTEFQHPSHQPNNESQAIIMPPSGPGRKCNDCPMENYPTPESIPENHQGGKPQPPAKKSRVVGKNSCECCRRSKVKCMHTPGMAKCKRCDEKGLDCVVTGVDNRTNHSTNIELYEVLNKNHALIQEFVALLYLLSPRSARTNQRDHGEAFRMSRNCLSPTKILEYFDKGASEFCRVEAVRELDNYRYMYGKLEGKRAAIKRAEEYGMEIMCELFHMCRCVQNEEVSEETIEAVLRDARTGRFRNEALPIMEATTKESLRNTIRKMYGGAPTPSPQTMGTIPRYPRPEC